MEPRAQVQETLSTEGSVKGTLGSWCSWRLPSLSRPLCAISGDVDVIILGDERIISDGGIARDDKGEQRQARHPSLLSAYHCEGFFLSVTLHS